MYEIITRSVSRTYQIMHKFEDERFPTAGHLKSVNVSSRTVSKDHSGRAELPRERDISFTP